MDSQPIAIFEEKPIQSKGCYGLPEEPNENFSEVEESGPLQVRIDSKNWKTRAKAYTDLVQDLLQNHSYSEYESKLLKILNDSNPNPQEKSLEVLRTYLENESKSLIPYLGGIVKTLIEKNISSSKQSSKDLGKDLIVLIFKLDKAQVTSDLFKYLDHKNPKLVSASINSLTSILITQKFRSLDLNSVSSHLAKVAEHTNQSIRTDVLNWFKELYRQVQGGVEPFIEKLKKQQQDELRKLFTTVEIDPCPQVDTSEFLETRDIFTRFNEKWTENVMALEKWTEKKEALEELNSAANYAKLAEKSPAALVAMAKRLMNDSNVHVVCQSVRLLGLLARGQRKFFESYAKMMAPALLCKFRDKNKAVVNEVHLALENFLHSVSADMLIQHVENCLNDKTVTAKINALLLIEKIFAKASKDGIRELFMIVKANTEDSNEAVRETCFRTLKSFINEFAELQGLIADLPDAKKKKIMTIVLETGKVATGDKGKVKEIEKEKEKEKEKENENERPKLRTHGDVKPGDKMDIDKPGKKPHGKDPSANAADYVWLTGVVTAEVLERFKEKNWKVRDQALKDLKLLVDSSSCFEELSDVHEAVFICLNDFKENNLNLVKSGFDCLSPIYNKVIIPELQLQKLFTASCIDKLAEVKCADQLKQIFLSISEVLGPNELVVKFANYSKDSNKVKTLSETCEVLNLAFKQFNAKLFETKSLLDYIKSLVQNSNPILKKSALNLLKTVYSKLGCTIYEHLEDLKDPLLKSIKDDLAPVLSDTSPETRSMRVTLSKTFNSTSSKRLNISSSITSQLLNELESKEWRDKKKSLEIIEKIIPKRLAPTGLAELMRALKVTLADSNKIIAKLALDVLSKIADALDEECSGYWRPIVNAIINLFKDKTSALRQAAKLSVDKWASKVGPEKVLNALIEPLKWDSIEARTEILNYIVANKAFLSKCETKSLVPSILVCLQDRTVNIRNQAEVVFGEIVEIIGFDPIKQYLDVMKPAVLQSLKPILDKYKGPVRINANSKRIASKYSPKFFFIVPQRKNKIEVQSWDKLPNGVVDGIRNEVKMCTSQELFELMFHADLTQKTNVSNVLEGMIENPCFSETFDLVFKWSLIEFYQNNTLSANIANECINVLLKYSKNKSIRPTDSELEMIIPVLSIKTIESSTSSYCKPTLILCFEIFNDEKAYNSLVLGLSVKNSLKLEVLNLFQEIFSMFKGPAGLKVFKFLENFAKAKEVKVRDVALEILLEICRNQGSSMLDYIDRGVTSQLLPSIKRQNIPDKVIPRGAIDEIISKLTSSNIQICFEGFLVLQSNLLTQFVDMEKYPQVLREELIDALLNFIHFLFDSKPIDCVLFVYETLVSENLKRMFSIILNFFSATNVLRCLGFNYIKSVFTEFILLTSKKEISELIKEELSETLRVLIENTETTTMIQVLFEILTAEISIEFSQITSKCINRCALILDKLSFDHSKVMKSLHEALYKISSEFFDELETRIKIIKLFLMELTFLNGEKIFEIYEDVVRNHNMKDEHIEDWIGVIFRGNYKVFLVFEQIKNGGNFDRCVEEIRNLTITAEQVAMPYFVFKYKEIGEKVDEALQTRYGRLPLKNYNPRINNP